MTAPQKPQRHLYHFPLSAPARTVRIALAEKQLSFEPLAEPVWERRVEFLRLNPAGEVPVLREPDGTLLCGFAAIHEFLDEVYPERSLIGARAAERAETRRLVDWFHAKFAREVTDNLVYEKVLRGLYKDGQPHGGSIRAGRENIRYHLEYVGWLTERRNWLAGEEISLADITAAAHLSTLDYLGDVPWEEFPAAKEWYVRIKSRPSFRPLLSDMMPNTRPAAHYAELDF